MPPPSADETLLQIMDRNFADAARRSGAWLLCREGCTQCCHGAFALHALDAQRLRAGLNALRTDDPQRAESVLSRARLWIAQHAAGFPGDAQTGLLGASQDEQERFEDFANEAACPALDPLSGRCDLYAWRPMTCRLFGPPVAMEGGYACCELCFQGASEEQIAASVLHVPHAQEEELLEVLGQRDETVVAFALVR